MHTPRRPVRIAAAFTSLLGSAFLVSAAIAQTPPSDKAQAQVPQPVTTPAHLTTGAYVFGDIGPSWLNDARTRGLGTTFSYDTGLASVVGGGWGFGNGVRVEGELGHRSNEDSNSSGRTSATSVMVNALYDFDTKTAFTPYVGVGTGFANVDFHRIGAPGTTISDNDVVWAYQGIAGVTYQLSGNWKLDMNYRYFGTERPTITAANGATADSHYRDNAVLFGVRYEFGP